MDDWQNDVDPGDSGILEHAARRALGYNDQHPFSLNPVTLDLLPVEGAEEAWRLSNRWGLTPTSEEFWTLVDHMARFYSVATDDEIRNHNARKKQEQDSENVTPLRPSVAGGTKPDDG
jgi:hypothetical protein